ncbi:MAG: hypothetical protein J6Y30_07070 [Treponema sp.]|nr:hypothetical protein [Treponema sp.]
MIYEKYSDGYEKSYKYDQKVNKIYVRENGREYWYEYDSSGNMIYEKDSDGYENRLEYDQKGNKIHVKHDNHELCYERELWYEYDSKGNITHMKDTYADGREFWYEYTFYPDGKIKSKKGYIPFK